MTNSFESHSLPLLEVYKRAVWKQAKDVSVRLSSMDICTANPASGLTLARDSKSVDRTKKFPWKVCIERPTSRSNNSDSTVNSVKNSGKYLKPTGTLCLKTRKHILKIFTPNIKQNQLLHSSDISEWSCRFRVQFWQSKLTTALTLYVSTKLKLKWHNLN